MKPVVKPTADPNKYIVGEGRACTLPNRVNDRPVAVACALPGVIILVHGVNDLGVAYPAQEQGLCQGLNERLWRDDMESAGYRLPDRNDKLLDDPDAVYYRRDGKGYSPVIPFYWGYREQRSKVVTNAPHGQYVDRHGNRLDRSGAQGGGPFANATSNLPDMWGEGFKPYGGIVNAKADDPTHPLLGAPDRRYMVLAAMRLAALVLAARHRHKDETVTLIGHSQGCLLSLLAQAFLDDWKARPADCLILNHPPYSLHEPWLESVQSFDLQQTGRARLATLQNLVRVVTEKPHAEPPLSALENSTRWGVCGPCWTAGEARRYESGKPADAHRTFAERDNRGKVYLYFCPEDLTVGLDNVIGIGSFGVPETITARDNPLTERLSALPSLGNRFFQRVFTMRERQGQAQPVGASPTTYCLRESGENFHAYAPSAKAADHRHLPDVGETRRITGEPLVPPCTPNLRYGEIAGGSLAVDPIDAAVAITNGGIGREIVDDPAGPQSNRRLYPKLTDLGELRRIEARLNAGKAAADHCRVHSAVWVSPGKVEIRRSETPDEARLRWQSTQSMENSYHSAIVANPEHSRHVHAFDVAIAQGESVSNPTYRDLLARLADWRVVTKLRPDVPAVLLKDVQSLPFYAELPERVKKLTEANAGYYTEGTLPLKLIPAEPPAAVVSETVRDVQRGVGLRAKGR